MTETSKWDEPAQESDKEKDARLAESLFEDYKALGEDEKALVKEIIAILAQMDISAGLEDEDAENRYNKLLDEKLPAVEALLPNAGQLVPGGARELFEKLLKE